jgi:hypothetical protein
MTGRYRSFKPRSLRTGNCQRMQYAVDSQSTYLTTRLYASLEANNCVYTIPDGAGATVDVQEDLG